MTWLGFSQFLRSRVKLVVPLTACAFFGQITRKIEIDVVIVARGCKIAASRGDLLSTITSLLLEFLSVPIPK